MAHTGLLAGEVPGRRLSAQDVRETVFPRSSFGGCNTEQVTLFMRRVSGELDLLDDEQAALRDEVTRLQQENAQLRQEAAARPNGYPVRPPAEQQAVHILTRAQQGADQLLADAHVQGRNVVEDARRQRERMLADGHAQARHVMDEALAEAGREAARLLAQAPIDAKEQLATYRGLAASARAGLRAYLRALTDTVQEWDEQEQQGAAPPLPQRRPAGPQPAAPAWPPA